MAVTGYTRGFIYNCLTHPDQAVEKRRFSYVRSPDYRY